MWEGARMCRWLGGREGARMGGVGMVGKVDEELSPFTSMSFLVKSCLWAGPLFLGYAVTQILLSSRRWPCPTARSEILLFALEFACCLLMEITDYHESSVVQCFIHRLWHPDEYVFVCIDSLQHPFDFTNSMNYRTYRIAPGGASEVGRRSARSRRSEPRSILSSRSS